METIALVFKDNRNAVRIKALLVSTCQLLSALLAAPAHAGDYEKLAVPIARAAREHGRKRLAVLPFESLGGKAASGRIVSERLVAPLMAEGASVVERSLLEAVLREQRLQVSGLVDQRSVRELGRILDVDAVVTGTVTTLKNDRLEVDARLIDAGTAEVLGAASERVEKDWDEPFFDSESFSNMPALPALDLAQPVSAADWGLGAPGLDCDHAAQDEDALERAALDLKARFWADKLRRGLDPATLTRNPGSEIRSDLIRSDFYALLTRYHKQGVVPLSQDERERLSLLLTRLKKIGEECGAQ